VDDEAWVRETLTRAGWPIDEEALRWTVLAHTAIRGQLQAIFDDASLGAVAPEVDLDASRAPRSR
jgi:hypothetical protein